MGIRSCLILEMYQDFNPLISPCQGVSIPLRSLSMNKYECCIVLSLMLCLLPLESIVNLSLGILLTQVSKYFVCRFSHRRNASGSNFFHCLQLRYVCSSCPSMGNQRSLSEYVAFLDITVPPRRQ